MYCSAQISKHIFYFGRHPVHPDNLPTRQDHLTLTSAHKPYKVHTQTADPPSQTPKTIIENEVEIVGEFSPAQQTQSGELEILGCMFG